MAKKNKKEVKKASKAVSIDKLDTLTKEVVMKESITKKERIGIVNINNLRLREGASIDSKVIKMLQKGMEVVILDDKDDKFYKVEGGFVMKEFINEK